MKKTDSTKKYIIESPGDMNRVEKDLSEKILGERKTVKKKLDGKFKSSKKIKKKIKL